MNALDSQKAGQNLTGRIVYKKIKIKNIHKKLQQKPTQEQTN